MKIGYGSDLHLEFSSILPEVPKGLDILLLAGDIFIPWTADNKRLTLKDIEDEQQKVHRFFSQVSERVKQTYMIMGNHEHYNGFYNKTKEKIEKEYLTPFPNIRVLENEKVNLDTNIALFGATFWTDFKMLDPLITWDCNRGMSDFSAISIDNKPVELYGNPYDKKLKFLPEHAFRENEKTRRLIFNFLDDCKEEEILPIIMTHHAPSLKCTPARFKQDTLSYAYSNTGFDDILEDNHGIWIHGHIHNTENQTIGKMQVLCNPRGYMHYDPLADDFKFYILDVTI